MILCSILRCGRSSFIEGSDSMASQAKDFPLREQSARRQCARNHRGEPDSTALNVAIQALLDAGHEEAVEPILED